MVLVAGELSTFAILNISQGRRNNIQLSNHASFNGGFPTFHPPPVDILNILESILNICIINRLQNEYKVLFTSHGLIFISILARSVIYTEPPTRPPDLPKILKNVH